MHKIDIYQKFQMQRYVFGILMWFLAVSCSQWYFQWLSSTIRWGVEADQMFSSQSIVTRVTHHTSLVAGASVKGVVSKFCSQHDLTKIPIKSDTEQKAYNTYAANDIKENVVSNSYETICMLSSKAMTLWQTVMQRTP